MINNNNNTDVEIKPEPPAEKPDDLSGIYIRGFLKITDPETGKTIIETGN